MKINFTARLALNFAFVGLISVLTPHAEATRSEEAHYKRIKEYENMISYAPEANTRLFLINKGTQYLVGTYFLFSADQVDTLSVGSDQLARHYGEKVRTELELLKTTDEIVRLLVKFSTEIAPQDRPMRILQFLLTELGDLYDRLTFEYHDQILRAERQLSALPKANAREDIIIGGTRYLLAAYMDSDLNNHDTATSFAANASDYSKQLRAKLGGLRSSKELVQELTALSTKIHPDEGQLPILKAIWAELNSSYERLKDPCLTALNSAQPN